MSHFEELLAASALTKFANQASAKKESQTEKQTNKCSRFPVQVRNQNIFQYLLLYILLTTLSLLQRKIS